MRIGSLFSGIGGLELGLEWAGVGHTVWQVEKDPYCRAVLAKHWPDATRYDDVCTVGAHNLAPVDVICGGFPCQDISLAGKGLGLFGERSGLWSEFAAIVGEMGPRYVVVENVAELLARGMGTVLGTLSELGYDAEWSIVSAASVGAPHLRERIFIIAYPQCERPAVGASRPGCDAGRLGISHDEGQRARETHGRPDIQPRAGLAAAADRRGARRARLESAGRAGAARPRWLRGPEDLRRIYDDPFMAGAGWPQPLLRRVDDGLSGRMDRLRAIGNAVVPQVAEVVGRRLLAIDAELRGGVAA